MFLEFSICIYLATLYNIFSQLKYLSSGAIQYMSQLSSVASSLDFRKALTISGVLIGHLPQVYPTKHRDWVPHISCIIISLPTDSFQDVTSLLLLKWTMCRLVAALCKVTRNQNFLVPTAWTKTGTVKKQRRWKHSFGSPLKSHRIIELARLGKTSKGHQLSTKVAAPPF